MPLFTNTSGPWLAPDINANAGTSHTLAANSVYLTSIFLGGTCVITGIRISLNATAAGNVDVGIYDQNNNLVVHSGSTSINGQGNTNVTISLTSTVLSAGRYLIALSPGSAADTFNSQTGLQNGMDGNWTATNASTGGASPVLPSSTGTLVNSGVRLVIVAIFSGAAP